MPDLIATLGSNPLPIVVVALHHRPQKLHIVATRQVEHLAERVWQLLSDKGISRGERIVLTDDARCNVRQLRAELDEEDIPWSDADLDYSGGTKLISAEALAWWREKNSRGTSMYLSNDGKIVYGLPLDSASPWAPAQAQLSFEELAKLHFEHKLVCGNAYASDAQRSPVQRIMEYVVQNGFQAWMKLLPPFRPDQIVHDGIRYRRADALNPANLGDGGPLVNHDLSAALREIGVKGSTLDAAAAALEISNGKSKRGRENTLKWLEGEWLEVAFAARLHDTRLFDEVHQDVQRDGSVNSGDQFQLDVVAIKGYRAFLFSCTTASGSLIKSKLFEAAHRAERIGGEYARAAVVTLSEQPHTVIQSIREDGWQGYDRFRAFGLPHLQGKQAPTYVETNGAPGPAQTLEEALRSWISE